MLLLELVLLVLGIVDHVCGDDENEGKGPVLVQEMSGSNEEHININSYAEQQSAKLLLLLFYFKYVTFI